MRHVTHDEPGVGVVCPSSVMADPYLPGRRQIEVLSSFYVVTGFLHYILSERLPYNTVILLHTTFYLLTRVASHFDGSASRMRQDSSPRINLFRYSSEHARASFPRLHDHRHPGPFSKGRTRFRSTEGGLPRNIGYGTERPDVMLTYPTWKGRPSRSHSSTDHHPAFTGRVIGHSGPH